MYTLKIVVVPLALIMAFPSFTGDFSALILLFYTNLYVEPMVKFSAFKCKINAIQIVLLIFTHIIISLFLSTLQDFQFFMVSFSS